MTTIHSIQELKDWINKFLIPRLQPKTAVLLDGEMGVGKTQLVKLFCEEFGCDSEVSSPTFSIIQEYPSPLGPIHHVDLYRIKDADELENTGFWEIFNKPKGIIFIEWPQKMGSMKINPDWTTLNIHYQFSGKSRSIDLK
jgi:tRNA threonylcarbamoyl adenosine modification protein YjeE